MKKSLRKDLSASGMYSLIHDHSKTVNRQGSPHFKISDSMTSQKPLP